MKVLLAIDDSPFSENATQFLASHYQSSETQIVVLHSTGSLTETDLSYSWAPTLDWEGVQKAEGLVSRAAHTLSQAGFKVTTRVEGGDPRVKVVESANLWPADLIVVGSHGRTGLTPVSRQCFRERRADRPMFSSDRADEGWSDTARSVPSRDGIENPARN